jgi:putative tryptophan/tyrosine transport system substrate-binding protein
VSRRAFLFGSALMVLAAPLTAMAQPAGKVARIGVLRPGSSPDRFVEAFRQGLRELGYTEGRDILIEYRWGDGSPERLPALAAQLVSLNVDVIVVAGNEVIRSVTDVTSSIPIVMPVSTDPVGRGLVASLGRPGRNVTGFASLNEELPGKWMELLREMVPRISRVAVLWDPDSDAGQLNGSRVGAQALGLQLLISSARHGDDIGTAFSDAERNRAEGLVVLGSPFLFTHRTRIVALAAKHRLPTIYHQREFVVGAGGLMSYAADFEDLFRRAAGTVDKILKGAKPGDLPVEQPTKFELVINFKTAKALGLTIPPSLLARADQVIN